MDLRSLMVSIGVEVDALSVGKVPTIWQLSGNDGTEITMSSPPLMKINDPMVATGVLMAGSGVMLMPMINAEILRREGKLLRALKDHTGGVVELFAVMPPRRAVIPSVAAFLDLLSQQANKLMSEAEVLEP